MQYFKNILTALSQLGNSLLAGSPRETICSRIWRDYPNTPISRFVDLLFLDKKHCRKAYLRNALRNQGKDVKGIC